MLKAADFGLARWFKRGEARVLDSAPALGLGTTAPAPRRSQELVTERLAIFRSVFCAAQKLTEGVGNVLYAAPELLRRNYGPQVDLWCVRSARDSRCASPLRAQMMQAVWVCAALKDSCTVLSTAAALTQVAGRSAVHYAERAPAFFWRKRHGDSQAHSCARPVLSPCGTPLLTRFLTHARVSRAALRLLRRDS